MKDFLKCEKCSESEHEGIYCRCEMRNLRIAKECRANGQSPWKKLRDQKVQQNASS